MSKPVIRAAFVAAAISAALAAPALAAPGEAVGAGLRFYTSHPDHTRQLPANLAHPGASKVIFSNLATKYPKGVYFPAAGLLVSGPASGGPGQQWIAIEFETATAATATQIAAAVAYAQGTNAVTLAIYNDASGVPGTAIASAVVKNLPPGNTCCALAVAPLKTNAALAANTPYWVVASTNAKQTTTVDTWSSETVDAITGATLAINQGSSWRSIGNQTQVPAFAIYGQ